MGDGKQQALLTAYQEACRSYHAIADFRAKLLGLLPLASGTWIFLGRSSDLSRRTCSVSVPGACQCMAKGISAHNNHRVYCQLGLVISIEPQG